MEMTELKRMLERCGANYSRPERWAEDNLEPWFSRLRGYSAREVGLAFREWTEKESRAPTLVDLLALVRGVASQQTAAGCRACSSAGLRDVIVHYQYPREPAKVLELVATCDCDKGRAMDRQMERGRVVPRDGGWAAVVERARYGRLAAFSGREEKPTILEVLMTTDEKPYLTWRERAPRGQPTPAVDSARMRRFMAPTGIDLEGRRVAAPAPQARAPVVGPPREEDLEPDWRDGHGRADVWG